MNDLHHISRTAPDAGVDADPFAWGSPAKLCNRCGIHFDDPGLQCIDCLDVLDMTRPGTTQQAPQPTAVVITTRNHSRRVNSGRKPRDRNPALSARWREEVPILRARGLSDAEIALTIGVSSQTVFRIRKELGIPPIVQHHTTSLRRAS